MMDEFPTQVVVEGYFRVESVGRVTAPDGGPGEWWRYVISQESNRSTAITGECGGSRAQVDARLAEMVSQLNERLEKPFHKQLHR